MNEKKLLLLIVFTVLFGSCNLFANHFKKYSAVLNVNTVLQHSFLMYNPADLNFTENFETDSGWTFTDGALPNKWMIGTGASNGAGTKALYISNNNSANTYTTSTSTTVVHAVKELGVLPADIGEAVVSFDWRCVGEGTTTLWDYFRVWIVPATFTPVYGTQIAAGNGIQFGGSFNQNANWQTANLVSNISAYAGQNVKLIFEWRNDGGGGAQPPAAIDNVLIQGIVCSAPQNLILAGLTDTTMSYTWQAGVAETSWEVVHQLSTLPAPTTTSVGTVVTMPNYTASSLTPNTSYNMYVRAVCSPTEKSFWIDISNKKTSLVPVSLPWIEDFEDGQSELVFTDNGTVNKWSIGSATACSGANSLYISNDNGTSNAYTTSNTATVVHAYLDVAVPTNAAEATFSFDWKAFGESCCDYLKVWFVSPTYQPIPGTQITIENSGGIQLGGTFNASNACTNFMLQTFNVGQYAGSNQRIVFEWRNDGSVGTQPPASVDNINFSLITCPRPIVNDVVKNSTGQFLLTWTPTGTETSWELVIQPMNSGVPGAGATIIPITGIPQYLFTPVQGQMYEFYVRAVCSATDKSLWQGPENFSDFNPPACADLDLTPLDLNINDQGEYVVCEGEDHVVNLEANFDPSKFKSTDSYVVEQIDYAPPFPFIGGNTIPLDIDDVWSNPVQLPFDVCYFGKNYTSANVGTNGLVKFGNVYEQGDWCDWDVSNVQLPNDQLHTNSIMVFHDIDKFYNKPISSVNFQVLGTYPCRALVVNFYEIPYYNAPTNSYNQSTSTFQIVVYEITNIIEIYVKRKPDPYTFMNSPINNGRSVMGIQNLDGTQGYSPPGRNTGVWSATEEAWRFSPNGDTSVEFGWYMDGQLISNNPIHSVTINETHDFEARVTYPGCEGGDELVLRKGFKVKISEEIVLGDPADLIFCTDNLEDEDRARITDNEEKIMENINDPADYLVTYHTSLEDADAGVNAITLPDDYIPSTYPETIFVRVMNKETECYELVSFDVKEGATTELKLQDLIICNMHKLPVLAAHEEYLYYEVTNIATGSTELVDKPKAGADLGPGNYEIFVKSTSKDGCYVIDSYNVQVFPCIIPKGISPNGDGDNDYLDLANYMVQDLKIFNRYGKEVYSHGVGYTRQWIGQDNNNNLLPAGSYFYKIVTPYQQFTGYIYITREVK